MRKQPGSWLRRRFLMRGVAAVAGFALLFGIAIGTWVHMLLPELAELVTGAYVFGFIVGAAALAMVGIGPRSKSNIEKGLDAETWVGQAIDYAVAAPGSAVAHGVTEIAKYGDIDHIVLTPARLWVVETKSGRVPNKEFRKVLAQIAANVAAVREWAPDHGVQVPVQGCLVLPSGEVTARDERGYDDKASGEKILVEDRKSLVKKLRGESRGQQEADNEGVKNVWGLGKMEE